MLTWQSSIYMCLHYVKPKKIHEKNLKTDIFCPLGQIEFFFAIKENNFEIFPKWEKFLRSQGWSQIYLAEMRFLGVYNEENIPEFHSFAAFSMFWSLALTIAWASCAHVWVKRIPAPWRRNGGSAALYLPAAVAAHNSY